MGRAIVITSGKGGVGKTTSSANLGMALAQKGHKVVLVDADIGLRNLDVVLGLENRIVFHLVDVIKEKCTLQKALIKDRRVDNLFLLPSSQTDEKDAVSPEQMKKLVMDLKKTHDFVIIDCPAGIEQGFRNAIAGADEAIVVATPEVSSIRDADRVVGLLAAHDVTAKLLVNRISASMVKKGDMLSQDDVIDILFEQREDQIKELLPDYEIADIEFEQVKMNEDNIIDKFTVTLFDFLEFEEIRIIPGLIEKTGMMKNPRVQYKTECNVGDYSNLANPHYLAFNFNKLDKVRDFNEFLKTDPRFGMEISMDQVEAKENFALVSRLTGLIAIILLGFSILSIVFYINSLLTTHLEGIKNNLGTLKAFGLNNKFLISVYIKIIILFIIISIIIGYLISFGIKMLEVGFSKIPVIDLFDYRIFITMIVILLFSSYISFISIRKILLKTPGDLIYNR